MSTATEARTFEFGGFRLDVAQRQLLTSDGLHVDLPSRAFDLLLFLVERPGELLDKSTLLKGVWPTTVVEESNLSQCIFALRRALGDTAAEHRFIVTVPGRGYQFVAPVRMDIAREEVLPAGPVIAPPGRIRGRRPLWMASGFAALALTALIAWLLWPHAVTTGSRDSPLESIATPQTIAVLPFADLSPAHDMEYFADGIAEEMTNSLARVGSLRVIGRQSAFAFKGTNEDARSIGEKLNVDSILEGSVRKVGERIRISARLVRTQDGFSLWAETYDRRLDDVLDIQSAIASEVAAALSPVINPVTGSRPAPVDEPQTQSPEAYNAYLRGIYLFMRFDHSDIPRSRDEFLRAVKLDPQFALAHAWLALTYSTLARNAFGNDAGNRSLAASSLDRAIELNPRIADLWWVRAWLGNSESISLTLRINNFERALSDNPNHAALMAQLAELYLRVGRRAEALDLYDRERTADPLWLPAILDAANASYLYRNDRQRALELIAEAESVASGDPRPADFRALMAFSEGRALDWDHWKAKAIEAAPRNPPLHGYLSLDYGHLGMMDAAMYHARVSQDLSPETAGAYNLAHINLFAGNVDAARPLVQRLVSERSEDLLAQLAQAELQYFTGDCGGAIHSLELAMPGYQQPAGSMDMMYNPEHVVILVWCLRKQRNSKRAGEFARALALQIAPPVTAGVVDGLQARLAAAIGDPRALVHHLEVLVETKSMAFSFVRHEPMIQPYLHDPEVKALLDTLDARRAEWRRILPKSSMRVPIPGIEAAK